MKYFKPTILVGAFFLILSSFFLLPNTADAGIIHRTSNNLGLVGYWTFNGEDLVDNVRDRSGQDNNGAISGQTNATSTTLGQIGQALDFDGSDDYVEVPDDPVLRLTTDGTVAFWVKFDSIGSSAGIVTNAENIFNCGTRWNYGIYLFSNAVRTCMGDKTAPVTDQMILASPTLGQWYHVVMTWNSTTLQNYVDSVAASPVASPNLPDGDADSLWMGANGGNELDGQLDDVRIYNRALSATEVSKLYQSGSSRIKTVSRSGLVGHWAFDDESGTDATDSSGNGNNGTLTSMDPTTDWVDGTRGGAIDFEGANLELVAVTSSASINNLATYTMAAWVKLSGYTNNDADAVMDFINNNGDKILDTTSSGTIRATIATSASYRWSYSNETIPLNTWTHITTTYTGGAVAPKVYINGTEATYSSQQTGSGTNQDDSGGDLGIGGYPDGPWNNNLNGVVDDVRYYNRVLTDAEILDLATSVTSAKFQSTQDTLLTDGLVGYWSFNGQNLVNNVADSSGQGNHGEINGQTSTTTAIGVVGQALDFDGNDDEVVVGSPDVLDDIEPVTVTAWVKFRSLTQFDGIVGKVDASSPGGNGRVWWMYVEQSGRMSFFKDHQGTNMSAISANNFLTTDEWIFLTTTWDGSSTATNVHLYKNGVETSSYFSQTDGTILKRSDAALPVRLGKFRDTGTMDGSLDEVRIYNRVLSNAEILRLYNMGL